MVRADKAGCDDKRDRNIAKPLRHGSDVVETAGRQWSIALSLIATTLIPIGLGMADEPEVADRAALGHGTSSRMALDDPAPAGDVRYRGPPATIRCRNTEIPSGTA